MTLTPDRLVFDLRAAAAPATSPDGTRIAYALSQADRETGRSTSQLWLIDADGANPRQLTTYGETNGGSQWAPDGQSIAYVSNDGSDRPYTVRVIDVDGGESRELARSVAAPSALAWSPDGFRLAWMIHVDPENPDETPRDPKEPAPIAVTRRLDYKQDMRGLLYDTRLQIVVLDVATGEREQITSAPVDHVDPQWSPDGTLLALKVLNRNGIHSQLAILDPDTREITHVGTLDWSLGTYRWLADGSAILFDGYPGNSPQSEYFRYDVTAGAITQLTDELPFLPESGYAGIGRPSHPAWLAEDIALVHGVEQGRSGLWTVNAESGELAQVAMFDALLAGFSVDGAGARAVATYTDAGTTGEIALIDLATNELSLVTQLNDDVLASSPPGRVERTSIERAGETIDYWITFPPDFDESNSYPVVLNIHGGPHSYFSDSFDKLSHALAAAGIIVVSPNPRGTGSYGRRFAGLVHGDWGGGDWDDLQAVLDTVLEEPFADANRTGVYGYSYGGYMSSWAIGHTNRFKAAVIGAPVFDLESMFGTSDIAHVWSPYQWDGTFPEDRERIEARSPSTYIHNAVTPTLIVHGEADHRCPIGQGEQLFVALATRGVEVEFVRYPGMGHLFVRNGPPAYAEDYFTRIRDWFMERL